MGRCGMFRGLAAGGAADNHVITTDDETFKYLGINTFTTGELWSSLKGYSARTNTLGGVLSSNDATAQGIGSGADGKLYYTILNSDEASSKCQILRWDKARKKYVHQDIDRSAQPYNVALGPHIPTSDGSANVWSVQSIIDLNDMLNRGLLDVVNPTNAKAKQFLLDVKTSQSGCVSWSQTFKLRFTPDRLISPASGACVNVNSPDQDAGVPQTGCLAPTFSWDGDFYPAQYEPGCVIEKKVHFQLFLYDNRAPRNNARTIVNRGAPSMAMIPQHPWGQQWSHQAYDRGDKSPGVFPPPEQGGDGNAANPAVGELDVCYNHNTGKMEAGNKQILARLTTIVAAVDISPLSETFDTLDQDDIFNYDSENYMGKFAVGYAIPMMLHNGNPYHFGPVWANKDCEANKKSKIRVVNRSSRTFAVGDVVMCTLIDGEWIIQDFGAAGPAVPTFELGQWSFNKFIVDRDSYFKDGRMKMYNSNSYTISTPDHQFTYATHTNPDAFEAIYRQQFYYSLYAQPPGVFNAGAATHFGIENLDGILVGDERKILAAKNLGLLNDDHTHTAPTLNEFEGSWGYHQTSSFDFLDKRLGGTHKWNIIGRVRGDIKSDGTPDESYPQYAQVRSPFWGAYFNAGYKADSIKNGRNYHNYTIAIEGGQHNNQLFVGGDYTNETPFRIKDDNGVPLAGNAYGPLFGGVYANTPDQNIKQMPADVALNAPPKIDDNIGGQNGSPIENGRKFIGWPGSNFSVCGQYVGALTRSNVFGTRYQWIYDGNGPNVNNDNSKYDPFYDWKPAGDQTLTFIPVTSDYVASWDDTTRNISPNHAEGFWKGARADVADTQSVYDLIPPLFWERNIKTGLDSRHPGLVNPYKNVHVDWVDSQNPQLREEVAIAYGPYVHDQHTSQYKNYSLAHWKASPFIGGTHGVTTARVGVTIKNAQLTLTTKYRLGLCNIIRTSAGGQQYYRKWGTGNEIHSKESTSLHAKVCGAWPASQTIFDPRYFGVFHFNPGSIWSSHATSGTALIENDVKEQLHVGVSAPENAGGDGPWWLPGQPLPDFTRYRDKVQCSVDFRIPSWFCAGTASTSHNAAGWVQNSSHGMIPVGVSINGAMQKGTKDVANSYGIVAPANEWRVDVIRRDMLLPFHYMKRTIALDPDTVVILDGGKEYKVGDQLKLAGGHGTDAVMKVHTTDNAQGNGFGAITSVDFSTLGAQLGANGGTWSLGEGYLPQDFINPDDPDSSPQIYADTSSGIGNGAIIYVKYGKVKWYWKLDKAPVRSNMVRLTPDSGGSEETHCGGLYDQQTTVTAVPMDEQSPDGRYEVFLHFQNDIAHNSAKDRGGTGEGFENYVSLTINAT